MFVRRKKYDASYFSWLDGKGGADDVVPSFLMDFLDEGQGRSPMTLP